MGDDGRASEVEVERWALNVSLGRWGRREHEAVPVGQGSQFGKEKAILGYCKALRFVAYCSSSAVDIAILAGDKAYKNKLAFDEERYRATSLLLFYLRQFPKPACRNYSKT